MTGGSCIAGSFLRRGSVAVLAPAFPRTAGSRLSSIARSNHQTATSETSISAVVPHSLFSTTVTCLQQYRFLRPTLLHPSTSFAASPSRPSLSQSTTTILVQRYIHTSPSTSTPATKTMDTNGDSRSKRKQPPTPSSERPMKQIKPGSDYTMGSSEYSNGAEYHNGSEIALDGEEPRSLSRAPTAAADTAEWQATVEKVIKNVVSIHFCQTHSFDTDAALASEATGFVVDAERGYILTNRVR